MGSVRSQSGILKDVQSGPYCVVIFLLEGEPLAQSEVLSWVYMDVCVSVQNHLPVP